MVLDFLSAGEWLTLVIGIIVVVGVFIAIQSRYSAQAVETYGLEGDHEAGESSQH